MQKFCSVQNETSFRSWDTCCWDSTRLKNLAFYLLPFLFTFKVSCCFQFIQKKLFWMFQVKSMELLISFWTFIFYETSKYASHGGNYIKLFFSHYRMLLTNKLVRLSLETLYSLVYSLPGIPTLDGWMLKVIHSGGLQPYSLI